MRIVDQLDAEVNPEVPFVVWADNWGPRGRQASISIGYSSNASVTFTLEEPTTDLLSLSELGCTWSDVAVT